MTPRPKRPQQPPSQIVPAPQLANGASWKDHPLVIAAGAVAATIALAVLLVKEVILPTHTASLNNQLSDLPKLQSEKTKLEANLVEMQRKLDDTERLLQLAQNTALFTVGSPYPAGLGALRVGDSISELERSHPATSIDRSHEGYFSVKLDHGAIGSVTYYFDPKLKARLISHIKYSLSSDQEFNDTFLQERLVESLGKPTANPRSTFYSWKTSLGVSVYKSDPESYLVMRNQYIPGWWPEE